MQKLNEMVYEYFSNKNFFKRHKYASLRHQMSSILVPVAPTTRELDMSLNYPYTDVRKMVRSKNLWMRHCSGTDWEGGIKDFSKSEG